MCLKESCFPDCWKVSSVIPVFNNFGERSRNAFFFFDFQYGFRSSRSTTDLLIIVSDRIAKAFNRFGATRDVTLDISKAFDRICHAGLLFKRKSWNFRSDIWPCFFFSQ